MSKYASLIDPSNPCNLAGLSDEVESCLDLLLAAQARGIDVVATSTTDHPPKTSSGNPSRHVAPGTNGKGLGVDARLRTRGNDIHLPVFRIFVPVERHCHELIYADANYNIKAGKRTSPYATSGHHDHVHISFNQGVRLFDLHPWSKEEDDVTEQDHQRIENKIDSRTGDIYNLLKKELEDKIDQRTGDVYNLLKADLDEIKAKLP